MLGLFGKKSDHPMSDLKSAQQLLAEMSKNDSLKALQEVTAWVESVSGDEGIRLDNRFAVLSLLDQTAHHHAIRLLRDYFALGPNSEFQEKRLWKALSEHYANLVEAYHSVLAGCRDGEKGAAAIKDMRPLIVARGINAIVGHLKCSAVHYVSVGDDIWEQLAEYLSEAEAQKCLDDAIELYPGASAQYSVRHQLAGVLLWWATGTGSLKPVQIHLSERVIAHLCRGLTLGQEAGADTLFVFDLTQHRPPVRYTGDIAAHPNLRFVGYGKVKLQLDPLIGKLEKGVLPGDLNLGGSYGAESVLDVANRLLTNWLSAPPVRRNVRRTLDVKLDIAKGYAGVVDVANQGGAGKGDVAWVAEDVSATGFRCVLESSQGNGIKVGSLIGFRPENVAHWGAGIVRRLRFDEQGKLDVGVEVLTNKTARVRLGEEQGPATSGDSFAVWLGHAGAGQDEVRMLLKLGNFDQARSLEMQLEGKQYMLMPQGLLEKGDDYDLARYRLLERESGE